MSTDTVYVAWQNEITREWVPVARLDRISGEYRLQYTRGAQRCPGFLGLGRMVERDKVYFSKEMFPFFQNRLLSKSRPEYRDYLRWLGLESYSDDPMSMLAVTAGLRATDSLELIPLPREEGKNFVLDFFARGISYFHQATQQAIAQLNPGDRLFLIKDVQNARDPSALLIRSESQTALLGYVPRYYARGLGSILTDALTEVVATVSRVNVDAPSDMRLLCRIEGPWSYQGRLFEAVDDFLPWTSRQPSDALFEIQRAAKALSS